MVRCGLSVVLVGALFVLWPVGASAQPVTGPHESVDYSFTTTRPDSPTGFRYTGVYHAAGDPKGNPPYMRKMVFYPPAGMRSDTNVPDKCTATDAQLELMGPAACPPGSRTGDGTTEGLFFFPFTQSVLDHYTHTLDLLNNTNEQIILVHAEGYAVIRGHAGPGGSMEYDAPTCFPVPPTGQCPDDYVLQLKSSSFQPPYTRTSGGQLRSLITTPPTCPVEGYWQTTIRFWWADGSVDSVVTKQPCQSPQQGAQGAPTQGPTKGARPRTHRHPRHRARRHIRRRH